MRARREETCFFVLLDERVDDAAVLTVDARDAAVFFELLEREEHVLVADHHGGIGHIHLERRDAGLEHGRDLGADGFVPVVDRHVEAVVAGGASVRFFMPELQTVSETLALVRTGEIDDHRRTAANGAAAAGVEVIGCRGVADIQVKVRVRVDKTREQQLSGDICYLRVGTDEILSDRRDLLSVYEDVRGPRSAAADHCAAL